MSFNNMMWWKKIITGRAWRTANPAIDPSKTWLRMCIFFLVGIVLMAAGIGYLRLEIARREEGAFIRTSALAQKLDQAKLGLILANHASTTEEFSRLQLQKPAVVDPGL